MNVLPRREYVDITSEVPGPEDRELPDLPPEPDGTTYAPIRRAIGKSALRPEDYKKVHRSSPIGQEAQKPPRPPKYLPDPVPLPEGANSSSSRTPPPKVSDDEYYPTSAEEEGPVNEYEDKKQTAPPLDNIADEPDYKKVRFEGDKKATSTIDEPDYKKLKRNEYDLKWLELLHEEAEREITHNDIFNVLEGYDGECLTIEIEVDLNSHKKKRDFIHNPVLFLTKKLNSSEVNLKHLTQAERDLFVRAKAKEVSSFLKNEGVRRCLSDDELKDACGSGRILRARWVLVWKPIPPDEQAEALADARNNEAPHRHQEGEGQNRVAWLRASQSPRPQLQDQCSCDQHFGTALHLHGLHLLPVEAHGSRSC